MNQTRHLGGFCLALLAFGLTSAQAENFWPEFRGPGAQGVSMATNVPVHWSANSNIAWKIQVPGKGWSSPVLADGKIYLTAAIEDDRGTSLRVVCLNELDGAFLWNVEAIRPDSSLLRQMHSKNSLASPTPILTIGRLYAHFGHLGTACLSLDGKVLWRQQDVRYSPVHGNGGSPVLIGSELVFSCDGADNPFVVALDADSGKVKWKTPRDTPAKRKFSFCTPLVVESDSVKQIVSPGSGFVAGYAPANGQELWRFRYGNGYSVVPRPIFSDGLLFISSGFDTAVLYAIRLEGATGDITASHMAWRYAKQVPTTPSMLVVGHELYFVSDGGIVSCLDARTGAPHWSERLEGNFSASPVCAEGRIYFQSEEGVGYVVKAGGQFELLAKNDLAEHSLASYAVADNRLFIRTEEHLWAVKH